MCIILKFEGSQYRVDVDVYVDVDADVDVDGRAWRSVGSSSQRMDPFRASVLPLPLACRQSFGIIVLVSVQLLKKTK